jgi:hypothetical protein
LPKEVFEEDVERLHRPKPILKPKPDETLTWNQRPFFNTLESYHLQPPSDNQEILKKIII